MRRFMIMIVSVLMAALFVPSVAMAGGQPDPVMLPTALNTTYAMAYQLEFETSAISPTFYRYYGLESKDVRAVNFWNGAYEQQIYFPKRDVVIVTGFGKEPTVTFAPATRKVRHGRRQRIESYIKATIIAPAGLEVFAPMTGSYNGFYDPSVPRG